MEHVVDFTEIIDDLKEMGFGEKEVTNSVRDIQCRLRWTVGSNCSIYSRSTKQWTDGQIAKVAVDPKTNEEWLTVQYLTTKKKQMQRFSAFLKPNMDFNDDEEFRNFSCALSALAFLPIDQIVDVFEKTIAPRICDSEIDWESKGYLDEAMNFFSYFERAYIGARMQGLTRKRPMFRHSLWNKHEYLCSGNYILTNN